MIGEIARHHPSIKRKIRENIMLRPHILLYFLAAILGIPSPLSAQVQADTAKAFVENLVEKARRIAAADLTTAQSRVE